MQENGQDILYFQYWYMKTNKFHYDLILYEEYLFEFGCNIKSMKFVI